MAEHVAEKYATKLLRENDIKAVLQTLDRLTVGEFKMTILEILDVVYYLFNSMQVIMDGAHRLIINCLRSTKLQYGRWQSTDRQDPTIPWCVWLICISGHLFT